MLGAVDIGGTKIAVGLVDGGGGVLAREDTSIYVDLGFDRAMARTEAILERQILNFGNILEGIGIGCTGPVDPMTGLLGDVNTLPGWMGCDPVTRLGQRFGVTAAMENDADAVALAEARWGSGKGRSRFICITVGTGIGSGLILDGSLYRGANNSHPELGHHILDPKGPLCTCGAYGCWEAMASGPALEAYGAALLSRPVSAIDICSQARKGEAWAVDAVAQMSHFLGMGLANIVTLFMPDRIALGGSVMKNAELFLDGIHRTIQRNCCIVPFQECDIVPVQLGTDAGLIGAAQVWRHRFERSRGISSEY